MCTKCLQVCRVGWRTKAWRRSPCFCPLTLLTAPRTISLPLVIAFVMVRSININLKLNSYLIYLFEKFCVWKKKTIGHNALRAPLYDAWVQRTEQQRLNDKTHVWLEAHVIADAVVHLFLKKTNNLSFKAFTSIVYSCEISMEMDETNWLCQSAISSTRAHSTIQNVAHTCRLASIHACKRYLSCHAPHIHTPIWTKQWRRYAACGVDVLDAFTGALLMRVPLDLTSKRSDYAAMITAAPVVADVDLDGSLDIVVVCFFFFFPFRRCV